MTGNITRYLILDLECDIEDAPAHERIYKLGALRTDSEEVLELSVKPHTLNTALQALDKLSQGAQALLGHNIIKFDLPLLREVNPDLHVLTLPVIDTLLLSPLAFPQNPYHRLIKDYKLVRDTLNSPLSDCRATRILFNDQIEAFRALAAESPEELAVYHCLVLEGISTLATEFDQHIGSGEKPNNRPSAAHYRHQQDTLQHTLQNT